MIFAFNKMNYLVYFQKFKVKNACDKFQLGNENSSIANGRGYREKSQ